MAKIKTVAGFDGKAPLILSVKWGDGVEVAYNAAELTDAIRDQLTHHGLKQKLMDAHSATYKETGSIAACRAATEEVWNTLKGGNFTSGRTSTPWIIECLSDLYDVEEDRAAEIWSALDQKAQRAVMNEPKVIRWKAERDLARADSAESALDLGSLFAKAE